MDGRSRLIIASIKPKPGRPVGTLERGGLTWSQSNTMRFILGSGISASEVKNRLLLIEEDVATTLPAFNNEKVALAILKMDLYGSTKSALKALRDKMAKGGIIVPLNYGSKFGAAAEAVHEVFPNAILAPCPTMPDKVMLRF